MTEQMASDEPTASTFADEGFERRFDALFRTAIRPAHRILRHPQAAEDVAAEVLARVYVDWSRLGAQPWLDAWITRVATNLAIDQVRRSKRRLPTVRVTAGGEVEVRLDLADAVARLPRRQREAIALRYFGDLAENDVAALLGISVGSVKTHIHRGMAALRNDLGDSWKESLA
jgi:RNA polymerase sigma factor (sigma-70 family)